MAIDTIPVIDDDQDSIDAADALSAEAANAENTGETPVTPADDENDENAGEMPVLPADNGIEKADPTNEVVQIIPVPGEDPCSLDGKCENPFVCYIGIAIAAIVVIGIIAALLGKCKSGKCKAKPQGEKYKAGGAKSGGKLVEIYVGNLSYDVDDALLLKQFTKFGVIKSARVVINRHNNKSKGYGFVEMPHREEAEIAIKKLNNHDLLGRPMKVNEARRDSRPPDKR